MSVVDVEECGKPVPVEESVEQEFSGTDVRLRVCVKTVGCQHNVSDGEQMCGVLLREGFDLVDSTSDADVVVLNGCIAKTPSQDQFLSQCARLLISGSARVVAAGCASQAIDKSLAPLITQMAATSKQLSIPLAKGEAEKLLATRFACLGVDQLAAVGKVIRSLYDNPSEPESEEKKKEADAARGAPATMKAAVVRLARTPSAPPLDLICKRRAENPLIVAVAACTGCLNACSYCKTFTARGRLRSHQPEEVVECVVKCVHDGAREVRLTGEDIGAYGLDIGTTLPVLVSALADALEKTGTGAMLRIGMANPPYMLSYVHELAKLFLHPNVYSYIHIPIQSGSDFVLTAMKRNYNVADFDKCVDALRSAVPDISIATDIIVGFPAEQEDDHLATLALLQKHRFPFVNINAMFVRPGTAAALMTPVPPQILKRRVREVSSFFNSYSNVFDNLVGQTVTVSVCEPAHKEGQWAAHTKQYVQVVLDKSAFTMPSAEVLHSDTPFQRMNVRITSAGKWSVTGVPV